MIGSHQNWGPQDVHPHPPPIHWLPCLQGVGGPHVGGLRGADVPELVVCRDSVPRQRGRSSLRPKLEYVFLSLPSFAFLFTYSPNTREKTLHSHSIYV